MDKENEQEHREQIAIEEGKDNKDPLVAGRRSGTNAGKQISHHFKRIK